MFFLMLLFFVFSSYSMIEPREEISFIPTARGHILTVYFDSHNFIRFIKNEEFITQWNAQGEMKFKSADYYRYFDKYAGQGN